MFTGSIRVGMTVTSKSGSTAGMTWPLQNITKPKVIPFNSMTTNTCSVSPVFLCDPQLKNYFFRIIKSTES